MNKPGKFIGGQNQIEKDTACVNECMACSNFEPFQRRLNQNRAKLYEMLEDEGNQDLVKINSVRRGLIIIKDLLETPNKLQEKINDLGNIKAQKQTMQALQNRKLREINV